jgi:hypothetical protein
LKRVFEYFGYELVRITGTSSPAPDLEFPVDFDEATIDTVRSVQGFTMTPPERIYALCQAIRHIVANRIDGDIVECGVWRGGSMMAAARTLLELGETDRELYLFDTFAGMPRPTEDDVDHAGVSALDEWNRYHHSGLNALARASLDEVRAALRNVDYPPDRIHLVKGMVEQTVPDRAPQRIALLRLDTDYYESTRHEMTHLYPRLAPGGVLIVDDYGYFKGARKAIDEYFGGMGMAPLLHRTDYAGRVVVKTPA